ncbi:hypothetical protein COO60DRAFT_1562560 [Scenedesmus sp. NREL 46B-D3]|nr:hypothetical protein COO60DRAFT_1562560 [Scenedesmus sp. NREL 46B-D3]
MYDFWEGESSMHVCSVCVLCICSVVVHHHTIMVCCYAAPHVAGRVTGIAVANARTTMILSVFLKLEVMQNKP